MNQFFYETMQGLLEAVAIDEGVIPIVIKKNMPAPTFITTDMKKNKVGKTRK